MMDFIVLTLSFTVAILLAMAIACVIMLQPVVMKWYTKKMFKVMNHSEDIFEELYEESK